MNSVSTTHSSSSMNMKGGIRKWVNIGGRGFPPMGQPTGEPSIVFWYNDPSLKNRYVLVQSNSNMNPTIMGKSISLCEGTRRFMDIDIARALWDYVAANGWSVKGSGEAK
jgi:hypothetical protein